MKYTIIALAALSGSAFAQTIINGNFSDTSGMTPAYGGTVHNGVPNGWNSGGVKVQVLNTTVFGNPGGFSSSYIDTFGETQPVTLSQDVAGFTPGQQYTISYDWGNRSASPYDMTISIGNGSASHIGTGVATATNNSFTFTAGATTETLSIAYNHTNGNSDTGFNSTNFKVTPVNPVPEPSSAALLGLGSLALILGFHFVYSSWKPVPFCGAGFLHGGCRILRQIKPTRPPAARCHIPVDGSRSYFARGGGVSRR